MARVRVFCWLFKARSGGEQDEALAWLERGFEQHDTRMTFLKIDPKLNNLRREPLFIDLMKRMKLQ